MDKTQEFKDFVKLSDDNQLISLFEAYSIFVSKRSNRIEVSIVDMSPQRVHLGERSPGPINVILDRDDQEFLLATLADCFNIEIDKISVVDSI